MSSEIPKLHDILDLKYGFPLTSEDRIKGNLPVYGSNGITDYHNESKVKGPGIIVGRKGNPGTINWSDLDFFPIDTTFYVEMKDSSIPIFYAYLALKQMNLPWYAADSAVPGINRNTILNLPFEFDISEKHMQVNMNNAENMNYLIQNTERIRNLAKDMVSALFRSWFIDFDPVKAKSEGKLPYGMDEETAALFPDSLEDSVMGPIPTGWRILTLDEILDTIIDHRGLTPKKLGGDWAEEGYPAISAMNIKNGKIVKRQNIGYVSEELYRKWMKVELKSGDILLTSEAPLGEIYYLFDEEKIVTSQRVFGIRSNPNSMPSIFLRYYLDSHFGQYELHARASGSTVSGIRQSELRKIKIITPSFEIMNYFSNKVKPLIENHYNCDNQLISLERTRDALLPRLMSGELGAN